MKQFETSIMHSFKLGGRACFGCSISIVLAFLRQFIEQLVLKFKKENNKIYGRSSLMHKQKMGARKIAM